MTGGDGGGEVGDRRAAGDRGRRQPVERRHDGEHRARRGGDREGDGENETGQRMEAAEHDRSSVQNVTLSDLT